MKKLVLLILFFYFISAAPCYAVKMIMNDKDNRIVYTRSNWNTGEEIPYDENNYRNTKMLNSYRHITVKAYNPEELRKNMKPEMIGTVWEYPEITSNTNDEETIQDNTSVEMNENISIRNSREAADYYTKEIGNDEVKITPSGFEL